MADSLDWTPLPERADERAGFDRGTQMHGDVRLNIAHVLTMWAAVHPGGSYADMCRIMANEVVKLSLPDGVPVAHDQTFPPSHADAESPARGGRQG